MNPNPASAIEVRELTRRYGTLTALDGVSFEVGRGELFGLIGPDGAGKTTLFRLLTTLIVPDRGTARVDGWDIRADYRRIRQCVGYMPGRFSLYPDLTVEENLSFFAALFRVSVQDNYELIAPIYRQIEPFRTRRAGQLSGGMKQKLALCCALVHRPRVLFLDEPTTGVDAVSRSEFWDMLARLREMGISMLVSTPYMDEAGRCDRVALINAGRILEINTPQGVVEGFDETVVRPQRRGCVRAFAGGAHLPGSAQGVSFRRGASFGRGAGFRSAGLCRLLARRGFCGRFALSGGSGDRGCIYKTDGKCVIR